MRPYYLTLLSPGERDELQLSIGNLYPGEKKEVVFCVSNKPNEEEISMGGAAFDYTMELVHTENLALTYQIFQLEKAADEDDADITTEDAGGGQKQYWKKKVGTGGNAALSGTDVSQERWKSALGKEEADTGDIQNRGKYINYTKDVTDGNLHLEEKTEDTTGYDAQYFVLEVEWDKDQTQNFEQYEKETDMIYMLVKAMQPRPVKK